MPPRFWYANQARTGSVYNQTSQDPEYPAGNLIDSLRSRKWITGILNPDYADIDLGSAKQITHAIILDHDLRPVTNAPGDTVLWWWSDTANFTVGNGWQVATVNDGPIVTTITEAPTKRYWRLHITKGNGFTTRTIGKIFLGTVLQAPPVTLNGIQRKTLDLTKTIRTNGGQEWAYIRPRYDEVMMKWTYQPLTFLQALEEMGEAVGVGQEIFMQVDQDAGFTKVYYGRLVDVPKRDWLIAHSSGNLFTTEVRFRESI